MKCCYRDRTREQTDRQLKRKSRNQPDQKVHWKVPREATEGRVLLTVSSDGVIDLRNVRCYVRHSSVIKPIDPYSRVPFNYFSIQVMKCSCHMLKRTRLMRKLLFQFFHLHPHPRLTKMNKPDNTKK